MRNQSALHLLTSLAEPGLTSPALCLLAPAPVTRREREEKPVSPTLIQLERPILDSRAVRPGAFTGVSTDFNIIGGVGFEAVEGVRVLWGGGQVFFQGVAGRTGFPVGHGVFDDGSVPLGQHGGEPAKLDRHGSDVARLEDLGVTLGDVFRGGEFLHSFLPEASPAFDGQLENIRGALVDAGSSVLILQGCELQGSQGVDILAAKLEPVAHHLAFSIQRRLPFHQQSILLCLVHRQDGFPWDWERKERLLVKCGTGWLARRCRDPWAAAQVPQISGKVPP